MLKKNLTLLLLPYIVACWIITGCVHFLEWDDEIRETSFSRPRENEMSRLCYELLDIPNGASEHEIKKAYKTIVRRYHPDRNSAPTADEITQVLVEVRSLLLGDGQYSFPDPHDIEAYKKLKERLKETKRKMLAST